MKNHHSSSLSAVILLLWFSIFVIGYSVTTFFSILPQHLLDCCVKESDDDRNSPDYHVTHQNYPLKSTLYEVYAKRKK